MISANADGLVVFRLSAAGSGLNQPRYFGGCKPGEFAQSFK
jgi:hypothetical protein